MAGERGGAVLVLAGPATTAATHSSSRDGCARVLTSHGRLSRRRRASCRRTPRPRTPRFATAGGATVAEIPAGWNGSLIVDGLFGIGLARPSPPTMRRSSTRQMRSARRSSRSTCRAARRRNRRRAGADHPRRGDGDVHRAQAGAADRRRRRSLRRHLRARARARRRSDRAGARPPARLAGARPRAARGARAARAQRAQGHVRHARHHRRRRRHGRRAAPRRRAPRSKLGAGKVLVGFAAREHPAVDWGAPELMLRSAAARACGASPTRWSSDPASAPTRAPPISLARALACDAPLVMDADALNLVAGAPPLRRRSPRAPRRRC